VNDIYKVSIVYEHVKLLNTLQYSQLEKKKKISHNNL